MICMKNIKFNSFFKTKILETTIYFVLLLKNVLDIFFMFIFGKLLEFMITFFLKNYFLVSFFRRILWKKKSGLGGEWIGVKYLW